MGTRHVPNAGVQGGRAWEEAVPKTETPPGEMGQSPCWSDVSLPSASGTSTQHVELSPTQDTCPMP